MLSYQHAFHAGNLADLHKHGALSWALSYLTRKDKPVSYIETHAGRGVYDLRSEAALKTGEAAQGIEAHAAWFDDAHPMSRVATWCHAKFGPNSYPGSPAIAAHLLRDSDSLHLAELHPSEFAALRAQFGRLAKTYQSDGFELAHGLTPPTPRRGLLLIDPPYEIKSDYDAIPRHIAKINRAWNVGVVMLWYPILTTAAHVGMVRAITSAHMDALHDEVRFPPARPGHGMIGSGLIVLNPPFGLDGELARLGKLFASLAR